MSEFKTKGRKLSALELEILGPIEPQDLIAREEGGLPTSEAPTIAKLRGIHTKLPSSSPRASETEVSAITSYSLSRISILKRDPSFKDLVAFYQKQKTEQFADVQKRLATLSLDAIGEIQERLAEKPDSISTSQLIELSKVTLDRAGYSPVAKSQNISVSMSAEELRELRQAANRGDVEVVPSFDKLEVKDGSQA